MIYKGYTIVSDNHFDRSGKQMAVRIEKAYPDGGKYICWHSVFTSAILFIRHLDEQWKKW